MQAAAAGGGAGTRSRVIGEGLPPRPNNERDRRFKIIVLGPVGGGKTSISRRYVHNTFALHPTTLGNVCVCVCVFFFFFFFFFFFGKPY